MEPAPKNFRDCGRKKRMTDWAAENSCRGYYANDESDLQGNRFFLATDEGKAVGYLFGCLEHAKSSSTV